MKLLNLHYLLISLILTFTLPACGLIKFVSQSIEQTEAISTTLLKEIGVEPSVSYNMNNGVTEVTVYFEQLTKSRLSVNELQSLVAQTVIETSKQEPDQIYLTIKVTQKEKI